MPSSHPWNNVVLACHFNSSMADESNNTKTLTNFNQAGLTGFTSRFGGTSLAFDGTGDYAQAGAYSSDFDFAAGDFTIECWLYAFSRPTQANKFGFILTADNIGVSRGWALALTETTGYLVFTGWTSNAANFSVSDTVAFPLNTWVHVAVCRSGTTMRLFRDGVVVATNSSAGGTVQSSGSALLLGGIRIAGTVDTNSGWNYHGCIDDLIVLKGYAQYTAAFTPPTSPFWRAQIEGTVKDANGNFAQRLVRAHRRTDGVMVSETLSSPSNGAFTLNCPDISKHYTIVHDQDSWLTYIPLNGANNDTIFVEWSGKPITANGGVKTSTAQYAAITGNTSSAYFGAAGDYLSTPANNELAFGTMDFTIECRVRLDVTGVERAIFDNRATSTDSGLYFYINASNQLAAYGNGAAIVTGTGATLSSATWYHVALVKFGGTITLYLNGTSVGSAASSYPMTCPGTVLIGRKLGSTTNDFLGYMDELVIQKGKAEYVFNFTPKTEPHTSYGINGDRYWNYVTGLWHFDGVLGTKTHNSLTGVNLLDGGGSYSGCDIVDVTSAPILGQTKCLRRYGGGYSTISNLNAITFGTGDFTVEFWVNNRAISGASYLIYVSTNFFVQIGTTIDLQVAGVALPSSTVSLNVWTHVAIVRIGSSISWYKNGVLVGTATTATAIAAPGAAPFIGYTSSWGSFDISELRITKGVGRYTSNFSVETSPFSAGATSFVSGHKNAMIYDHLTPV